MKIVITGHKGMLGRCLMRHLHTHECVGMDLPEHDLCDPLALDASIARIAPQVVIHAAAFTQVDACEENCDAAWRVNALGSAHLALACQRHGARLLAISTDYVFAGDLDRPYHEWDQPCPLSVYGASKHAGELAIQRHCPDHSIIRIAWLYGAGGPSFFHTMARLASESNAAPLRVVNDQIGNPTSTDVVAELIAELIDHPIPGIIHGTCEGECSWFDFTQAIINCLNLSRGVEPCSSAAFPRPAARPTNSRLEKRMLRLAGRAPRPHWREALERFVKEYPDG